MTFNFGVVSKVVTMREQVGTLTFEVLESVWPEHYSDGEQFNSNLDKIDIICGGLIRNIQQ